MDGAKAVVLRVPVLYVPVHYLDVYPPHIMCLSLVFNVNSMSRYGPIPKNSDSAINFLVDVVQDQSGKQYTIDHYATRYPTNVVDIAAFLVRLYDISSSFVPSFRPPFRKLTFLSAQLRRRNSFRQSFTTLPQNHLRDVYLFGFSFLT